MKAIVLVFQGCVEKVAVVPDEMYEKVLAELPGSWARSGVVSNERWDKIKDLVKLHFVEFTSVEMG